MQKNMLVLVKNNLIAIAIHVCICFFFIYPILFLGSIGNFGLFMWIVMGVFIMTAFYLYFWTGKKLLSNTHDALTNVYSVIGLVIILTAIVLFLVIPEDGVVVAVFYSLVLAPLPSLVMWLGMWAKLREDNSNKEETQKNEK